MVKQSATLFKNRRATREFLYSRSDAAIDATETDEKAPIDADQASIASRFPGILDRKGLIDAVETGMQTASRLAVIAVQIDTMAPGASGASASEQETAVVPDALDVLAACSRENAGVWGRISAHRFALAIPGHRVDDAMTLARSMMDDWPDPTAAPVTMGIAVFPTLDESRGQTIANADKALDHGAFLGPGTITPFDAVSLNISGDRHYQAGDIRQAVADFEKGLVLDPSDVNLHNSLGVCYGVLDDRARAFAAFERAIALSPGEVMPVYNKGYLLMGAGDLEAALDCFLKVQAMEPDIFEVVYHIGQVLMEMGDVEQAHAYLTAALGANDRSGPAHKLMGDCLAAQGQIRKAIQAYKNAVKINPEDADSLSALGLLYARIEESLDIAAVLCTQSVCLHPDNGLFHHRLGEVYVKQAKFDAALAAFEAAAAKGHDSRERIAAVREAMRAARAS